MQELGCKMAGKDLMVSWYFGSNEFKMLSISEARSTAGEPGDLISGCCLGFLALDFFDLPLESGFLRLVLLSGWAFDFGSTLTGRGFTESTISSNEASSYRETMLIIGAIYFKHFQNTLVQSNKIKCQIQTVFGLTISSSSF